MFFGTSLHEEELRSSPGTLGKPACGAAGGTCRDGEPEVDVKLIPADETGMSSDSI